eukprot:gb/GEZJ01001392.1/.p3 GENE.gb/GEZJ01001392.1/~~gb/GEZJ01001392.1/.p3  ORF type:complete len:140 (-),score=23.93 gb/GEZJ01001392.1/:2273-2692(-)
MPKDTIANAKIECAIASQPENVEEVVHTGEAPHEKPTPTDLALEDDSLSLSGCSSQEIRETKSNGPAKKSSDEDRLKADSSGDNAKEPRSEECSAVFAGIHDDNAEESTGTRNSAERKSAGDGPTGIVSKCPSKIRQAE